MVVTRRQSAAAVRDDDDVSIASGAGLDVPGVAPPKKSSDLVARAVSGLAMSAAFVLVLCGGHMWVAISVIAMEVRWRVWLLYVRGCARAGVAQRADCSCA